MFITRHSYSLLRGNCVQRDSKRAVDQSRSQPLAPPLAGKLFPVDPAHPRLLLHAQRTSYAIINTEGEAYLSHESCYL